MKRLSSSPTVDSRRRIASLATDPSESAHSSAEAHGGPHSHGRGHGQGHGQDYDHSYSYGYGYLPQPMAMGPLTRVGVAGALVGASASAARHMRQVQAMEMSPVEAALHTVGDALKVGVATAAAKVAVDTVRGGPALSTMVMVAASTAVLFALEGRSTQSKGDE
ncbi:MAG: hypothetical protein ACFCBW_04160 [Candidatus Competibacterales bacterium]